MLFKLLSQIKIEPGDLNIPQSGTPTDTSVQEVLQIVFGLIGGIAMLVIVIAGIMFILSQGDPQKAGKARSAIIYAAIGVGISLVAFSVVRFAVETV